MKCWDIETLSLTGAKCKTITCSIVYVYTNIYNKMSWKWKQIMSKGQDEKKWNQNEQLVLVVVMEILLITIQAMEHKVVDVLWPEL